MNQYILLILVTVVYLTILTIIKKKIKLNIDVYFILAITITYSFFAFYLLGSLQMCNSYYQPTFVGEEIIFEIKADNHYFNKIIAISTEGNNNEKSSYQIYYHDIEIYGSDNLIDFQYLTTLDQKDFAKYNSNTIESNYQYIKLKFTNINSIINEIAFYNNDTLLDVSIYQNDSNLLFNPNNLIDEQNVIPLNSTYYNETYFDEIYHARNGLEIATGSRMYASVHPLLGTVMISLGIRLFGFNPFGYRFFGALISILMLPLIYLLTKKMFKNSFISTITTIFLATDFMHFTTGRIATLEPFSIFTIILMYYFMYNYFITDFKIENKTKIYKYLYLTSFAMSLAWAVKWTGIYATMGIVLLYFYKIFKEYNQDNKKMIIKIILLSILFYVIQPLIVYIFVYSLTNFNTTPITNLFELVKAVIDYTLGIFDYHHNLNATHPFQSVWYQWIFNIRPIWYYYHDFDGIINTISCFNNPIISIAGLASVLYCFYDSFKTKSKIALFISIGYLSQLLPWVLVTRCIFSYHYYPSVIFLVLAIGYTSNKLISKDIRYKKPILIIVILAIILFLLFLPVISGLDTTKDYVANVLQWLQSWTFYV
jgi:dolichyl-phosphate-mannose--protein O-mannosyl transferase